MNELQIFNNNQFGEIRTTEDNGKVLFCGADVAKALGYARPNDAINAHCRCTVKCRIPHPQAPDKEIEMSFIPEGDVYRLITHSKLPTAEKFERWVFDEVLPSIRKHGMYATPTTIEQMIADPANAIKVFSALKQEQERRKELEATVEHNAPKVLFAEAVQASHDSCLVGQLAKMIRQNGKPIGANRMFTWLRDNGWLCKKGENWNMPTQKAMEAGYFEIKETVIANPDGSTRITRTPKVTGKGQIYFIDWFLRGENENSCICHS